MTSYVMYRGTTVGTALQDTLDQFVDEGLIPKHLALKVMTVFDRNINRALTHRAKNKMQFSAQRLATYRFCDNVWTFVLEGVEFRDSHRSFDRPIDRVKVVACDGRPTQADN